LGRAVALFDVALLSLVKLTR